MTLWNGERTLLEWRNDFVGIERCLCGIGKMTLLNGEMTLWNEEMTLWKG